MSDKRFTFSDTISGYVSNFDRATGSFNVTTAGGNTFKLQLTSTAFSRIVHNLAEGYADATGRTAEILTDGQYIHAYGVFYPQGDDYRFEVKSIVFPGQEVGQFRHEEPTWWVQQIQSITDSYLKWQFNYPQQAIDYRNYRTFLHLDGVKRGDFLQETDTISRMVYGMASAYLLTGHDRFLEAAERGTEYLREHARFYDANEGLIYWYHGIQVSGERETKLLTSEFGDDLDSLPMYEQIYALAGPVQTFRITGDPRILTDADNTVKLFDRHYIDRELGGYFSHIDPLTLDPRAESLAHNRARKNWNSVGDHAPAYLINLWLATGDARYAEMLERTFDTISARFPDYDNSPFVNERFFEDWSHDQTWGWQQNRAVVGHNLKIAWNLMRMYSLKPKEEYVALARHIAEVMPAVGSDQQRGGWYDVVERTLDAETGGPIYVWHDRKAWWQQEQAILAYLILRGVLGDESYLTRAREAASFYNSFFLDHDDGGVYFNVLANGMPYLLGNERLKGNHSMSAYHSTELCYLSAVYQNLLINDQPLDLYFKPRSDASRTLRVQPDILPHGSVRLEQVWIDDQPYTDFQADALTVTLPNSDRDLRVRVRIVPTKR